MISSPDAVIMQAFMWQEDIAEIARFIQACFADCGISNWP